MNRHRRAQLPALVSRPSVCLVALACVALAISAPAASPRAAANPQLTVTVNADGSLHASWTKPADQDSYELVWDSAAGSNGRLTEVSSFDQNGNCAGGNTGWCWPANGDPLYCYEVLYNSRTGDCPGHDDLGDAQTELDTPVLQRDAVYDVQVMTADHCFGQLTCRVQGSYTYEHWSNVVKIKAVPAKGSSGKETGGKSSGGNSSGGKSSGGKSSGGGATGTARVSFTQTVTVTKADGSTVRTKSTVLVPGDLVRSLGSPTHLSVRGGALVLDRDSALAYEGDAPAPVWQLESGEAYYSGTTGRTIHNVLEGRYAQVLVCCGAGAVLSVAPGGDTISVVAAGTDAPATGPVMAMKKGSSSVGIDLAAGQQVVVRGAAVSAFSARPKRFVPTRVFWK